MVFSDVAPCNPRGLWCEQFWIYIISGSFHVNMTYSGSVVLERKIFKWSYPIFAFLWLSPLWKRLGILFEQFRIPFTRLVISSLISFCYALWKLRKTSCYDWGDQNVPPGKDGRLKLVSKSVTKTYASRRICQFHIGRIYLSHRIVF
jgi:hypothetical protein